MASIYSIVYKPKDQPDSVSGDDYNRVPIQMAHLVVEYGIEGDQKGGHHPDRQLNVLSQEWLQEQQAQGFKTEPGQFGEQIIISGLAVENLSPGTQIKLGGDACIQVTNARTGCTRFEAAQGKSVQGLGALGVMAKVVAAGTIRIGDSVTVLETVE